MNARDIWRTSRGVNIEQTTPGNLAHVRNVKHEDRIDNGPGRWRAVEMTPHVITR